MFSVIPDSLVTLEPHNYIKVLKNLAILEKWKHLEAAVDKVDSSEDSEGVNKNDLKSFGEEINIENLIKSSSINDSDNTR